MLDGASSTSKQLEEEIVMRERRASLCETLARWAGYVLLLAAIVLSFAAFVVGSHPEAEAYHVAVLAAFSGLCSTINTAFNFNSRADWFCRRKNAYRRLLRSLRFAVGQPQDVEALALAVSTLQESTAADFPRPEITTFSPSKQPLSS